MDTAAAAQCRAAAVERLVLLEETELERPRLRAQVDKEAMQFVTIR